MSAGRTGKPSGAARSTSKRHPPVASGQPDFRSARNRAYRERPSGEPGVRAPAMLEALAPRPRGGTVDTADLKSASGKPECRFESGRGHHKIPKHQAVIATKSVECRERTSHRFLSCPCCVRNRLGSLLGVSRCPALALRAPAASPMAGGPTDVASSWRTPPAQPRVSARSRVPRALSLPLWPLAHIDGRPVARSASGKCGPPQRRPQARRSAPNSSRSARV